MAPRQWIPPEDEEKEAEIRQLRRLAERMGPMLDFDDTPRGEEERIRQEAIEEQVEAAMRQLHEIAEREQREQERRDAQNRDHIYNSLLRKLTAEKEEVKKIAKKSKLGFKPFKCPNCRRDTSITIDPYYANDDNTELIQETWCQYCEIEVYFHFELFKRTKEDIS